MKIKSLYQLVRKVNLNETYTSVVKNNDDNIVDLVQDQLSHGFIKSKNQLKQFSYKDSDYRNYKLSINARANGYVDLRNTGKFYEGMYLDVKKSATFKMMSNDSKFEKLKNKYGNDILGLGGKYIAEMVDTYIYPNLMISLRKQLQL